MRSTEGAAPSQSSSDDGLESLERRELLAATLDPTFGTGGLVTASFARGALNSNYGAAARQPDGKLVLVGSAIGAGGNSDFAITRLNADGYARYDVRWRYGHQDRPLRSRRRRLGEQ